MKNITKHTLTIQFVSIFSLFSATFSIAQSSVNSAGGNGTGSGGSVSSSVGQVAFRNASSGTMNINEGVQQPYEIYSLGVNETELIIDANVFPNPTTDKINLKITNFKDQSLNYQLTDLQGKTYDSGSITSESTEINMKSLVSGTYFLSISDNGNETFKSFKIIKNQ